MDATSILRCAVAVGEGFSRLGLLSGGTPRSYASHDKSGFGNLMFSLWFAVLGGSFVFLDMMGPFILFIVFSLFFWVLWFIYDWQGFISTSVACVSLFSQDPPWISRWFFSGYLSNVTTAHIRLVNGHLPLD
jgi:hypothetical protein